MSDYLQLSFFNWHLVARDVQERGRDLEHILNQYTTLVKPAFEEFCLPVSVFVLISIKIEVISGKSDRSAFLVFFNEST